MDPCSTVKKNKTDFIQTSPVREKAFSIKLNSTWSMAKAAILTADKERERVCAWKLPTGASRVEGIVLKAGKDLHPKGGDEGLHQPSVGGSPNGLSRSFC